MREWHKPTIEETESGMEVTSYLPAELERLSALLISETDSGDQALRLVAASFLESALAIGVPNFPFRFP
jgi:coenzyme PQQ precursor peptide PqqA